MAHGSVSLGVVHERHRLAGCLQVNAESQHAGLYEIQLYRATGSISANIAEGHSRQSGKDQADYYEYALGSTHESRTWYYQARHIFTDQVVLHRIKLLTSIIRLLMTMIPAERGYKLLEAREPYEVDLSTLLNDIPFA